MTRYILKVHISAFMVSDLHRLQYEMSSPSRLTTVIYKWMQTKLNHGNQVNFSRNKWQKTSRNLQRPPSNSSTNLMGILLESFAHSECELNKNPPKHHSEILRTSKMALLIEWCNFSEKHTRLSSTICSVIALKLVKEISFSFHINPTLRSEYSTFFFILAIKYFTSCASKVEKGTKWFIEDFFSKKIKKAEARNYQISVPFNLAIRSHWMDSQFFRIDVIFRSGR